MLLKNVHRYGLDNPPEGTEGQISAVMGEYEYWHYLCDSFDDRGWGCGYRTLQTIASWTINHFEDKTLPKVESIHKYQAILGSMGQEIQEESRDWIGTVEACMVIDLLYNIPCKVLHCKSAAEIHAHIPDILTHFSNFGAPLMMGGENDQYSKGIFGIARKGRKFEDVYLLIVDPHYASESPDPVQARKFVYWKALSELEQGFYNLLMPLSYKRPE